MSGHNSKRTSSGKKRKLPCDAFVVDSEARSFANNLIGELIGRAKEQGLVDSAVLDRVASGWSRRYDEKLQNLQDTSSREAVREDPACSPVAPPAPGGFGRPTEHLPPPQEATYEPPPEDVLAPFSAGNEQVVSGEEGCVFTAAHCKIRSKDKSQMSFKMTKCIIKGPRGDVVLPHLRISLNTLTVHDEFSSSDEELKVPAVNMIACDSGNGEA